MVGMNDKNRTYDVRADGDIIRLTYHGDQTTDTLDESRKEAVKVIAEQRNAGKPILFLVDLREMGDINVEARSTAIENTKNIEFDRSASFGASPFIRSVTRIVIRAAEKRDKMGYFETEGEALAWLTS